MIILIIRIFCASGTLKIGLNCLHMFSTVGRVGTSESLKTMVYCRSGVDIFQTFAKTIRSHLCGVDGFFSGVQSP